MAQGHGIEEFSLATIAVAVNVRNHGARPWHRGVFVGDDAVAVNVRNHGARPWHRGVFVGDDCRSSERKEPWRKAMALSSFRWRRCRSCEREEPWRKAMASTQRPASANRWTRGTTSASFTSSLVLEWR